MRQLAAPAAVIRNKRLDFSASVLALLACFLWGGNSVFIKVGLVGMPPIAMAGVRFLLGVLVVWGVALGARISIRVPAMALRPLGGLSILFIVQILLLHVGTDFTLASRSTVAISTYPFFTAFFAHFFIPGDRLSVSKVMGMVLSFGGVVLIFGESLAWEDKTFLLGDLMVLVSGMLLGFRQVVLKYLVQGFHPYQVLFWQGILSLPVFFLLSMAFERDTVYHLTPAVIGAVLYQGVVVAGFCFILWIFLLQHHSASRLGVFGFSTPVIGVVLSTLVLDELLSPLLLASLVLVAVGIVVVSQRE